MARKADPERSKRMADRAIALLSDPEERDRLLKERKELKRCTHKYTEALRWPYISPRRRKKKKKKRRRDRKIRSAA